MKLTVTQYRPDRGRHWSVRRDGIPVASFSYSFHPHNDGGFFSSNHGRSPVTVSVSANDTVLHDRVEIGKAKYMRDADKLARAWFRTNNVRATLFAIAKEQPK